MALIPVVNIRQFNVTAQHSSMFGVWLVGSRDFFTLLTVTASENQSICKMKSRIHLKIATRSLALTLDTCI